MKHSDLYVFREGLEMAQMIGSHFTYAVKKNKDMLEIEIKAIEEPKKPAENFKAYLKELDKLEREHAEKDLMGKPMRKKIMVTITRSSLQYIIPGRNDPKSKYGEDVAKLNNKHRASIEAQEKKEAKFVAFLSEESEWKPFMIDLNIVPNDIHQGIMDRIIWMINDVKKL